MGIVLVALAVTAVALILAAGIYTMLAGGKVSKDWSNRLMRYRIVAQFVAIIIMTVLYFTSQR